MEEKPVDLKKFVEIVQVGKGFSLNGCVVDALNLKNLYRT